MNISPAQPQTLPCDIVLLPNEEQAQIAAQASQTLSSRGSLFTLDNQNFYAHASLYMFQMNLTNQDACIEALQRLAQHLQVQRLTQDDYFYQDTGFGRGYIDIAFARNLEVDSLQDQVIATFNTLRGDMRESDKQKMTDATGLKLENLQKYGYPSIGELFRPHITLTKFPPEIEPDLSVLPPASSFSGGFNRIGLFEMGANGTCIRKISEFSLLPKPS